MDPSVDSGTIDNIGPAASLVDLADIDRAVDSGSIATLASAAGVVS